MPESLSVPVAGSAVMVIWCSAAPVAVERPTVLSRSVKPKLGAVNTRVPTAVSARLLAAAVGASFN